MHNTHKGWVVFHAGAAAQGQAKDPFHYSILNSNCFSKYSKNDEYGGWPNAISYYKSINQCHTDANDTDPPLLTVCYPQPLSIYPASITHWSIQSNGNESKKAIISGLLRAGQWIFIVVLKPNSLRKKTRLIQRKNVKVIISVRLLLLVGIEVRINALHNEIFQRGIGFSCDCFVS